MDESPHNLRLQLLTQQLASSLEHLRDALQNLSLSLKDRQLTLNPEAARATEELTNALLRACAQQSLPPPSQQQQPPAVR